MNKEKYFVELHLYIIYTWGQYKCCFIILSELSYQQEGILFLDQQVVFLYLFITDNYIIMVVYV